MKKVLMISNSMGLPRDEILYEKTWPYLLMEKQSNFHYIQRLIRAILITDLTSLQLERHRFNTAGGYDFLELFKPHIVILELGITDCAPRLFSQNELKWFRRLRVLTAVRSYREKFSIRKQEKATTSLPDFRKNLDDFVQRCFVMSIEKLIFIPMASATEEFLRISPEVQAAISRYNAVFEKLSEQENWIHCLSSFTPEQMKTLGCDMMHYNEEGHHIITNQLAYLLET